MSDSSENTNNEVPFHPGLLSVRRRALEPHEDRLLSFATLGERWECHSKTAAKRVDKLKIPKVRINRRVVQVRLSDVLRAETEASV